MEHGAGAAEARGAGALGGVYSCDGSCFTAVRWVAEALRWQLLASQL